MFERIRNYGWFAKGYLWMRNQDLVVLLLMLGAVLGLWGFFELADAVMEGSTRALDDRVLMLFREAGNPADPIGPLWLEDMVRDMTALGGVTVLLVITIAVSGFVLLQRQHHAFWLMLGAIGGGVALNLLLKGAIDRPRPELVPHLSYVATASFPSGHSMLSAVVYLTLAALLARLVATTRLKLYVIGVALFFTFLVGVSRVYLGVHYPTDVLAGWTLGLLWAVICWLTARFLQRQGKVERPEKASGQKE
jgi:undecaprenyl-diphosphatase